MTSPRHLLLVLLLGLALYCPGFDTARISGLGAEEPLDVDDLPRARIPIPDGTFIYNVRYLQRNWREATQEELKRRNLPAPEDICLEIKLDQVEGEVIKPLQYAGLIVCRNPQTIKVVRTMERGDNLWLCGTLRSFSGRPGVYLEVEAAAKLPQDVPRMTAMLERLEKKLDSSGLMELGQRIGKTYASNIYTFDEHSQFMALQARAYASALTIREGHRSAQDADGLYAVAEAWQELLHRTHHRNELIRKVLTMDPDHPRASRVATQELGLVKHEGRWVSLDERAKLLAQEEARRKAEEAKQHETQARKATEREKGVLERPRLMAQHQDAIRMAADGKALEGALRSLGEAVQKSPDPVFCYQGVDILAQMPDPTAVWGLTVAARNELPEVRQDAYEALAWRGDANGLKFLVRSLADEADVLVARHGVEALVRRRDKPALATLIEGLRQAPAKTAVEFQEGLRQLTRQNFTDRDAWLRWWEANRSAFSPP